MMIESQQTLTSLLDSRRGTERARATTLERTDPAPTLANRPAQVDFGDVLAEAVDGVRMAYKEAGDAQTAALLGRGTPHQAMIAGTKAGIAFRFMVQTRHKLVEAYREMMSLQI
jgi:flagellar hook-basal body complex protein FliE